MLLRKLLPKFYYQTIPCWPCRADADLSLWSKRSPPTSAFEDQVIWITGASQVHTMQGADWLVWRRFTTAANDKTLLSPEIVEQSSESDVKWSATWLSSSRLWGSLKRSGFRLLVSPQS